MSEELPETHPEILSMQQRLKIQEQRILALETQLLDASARADEAEKQQEVMRQNFSVAQEVAEAKVANVVAACEAERASFEKEKARLNEKLKAFAKA